MKKITFMLFLLCLNLYAYKTITPSDVYSEVKQIEKEVLLLKEHFGLNKKIRYFPITSALEPRHAWQKTYEIIIKINILRHTKQMPIIEPANMQPILEIDPILTYEQTQRILTELNIFKTRLSIKKQVSKKEIFYMKRPLDVYNLLNKISLELDIINGKEFSPSYVFGESMRIYDDLAIILSNLNITNETIPPKRVKNYKPEDSYKTGILIINRLNKLKRDINLKVTSFNFFIKEKITPSDVFSLNQVILSELQVIKAYLNLNDYVTPPARKYKNKTPTDVNQLLGWCLRSLNLIKSLEKGRIK